MRTFVPVNRKQIVRSAHEYSGFRTGENGQRPDPVYYPEILGQLPDAGAIHRQMIYLVFVALVIGSTELIHSYRLPRSMRRAHKEENAGAAK